MANDETMHEAGEKLGRAFHLLDQVAEAGYPSTPEVARRRGFIDEAGRLLAQVRQLIDAVPGRGLHPQPGE